MPEILIADDEHIICESIEKTLRVAFLGNVTTVYDGNSALNELNSKKYDLAILDFQMPGINGLDIVRRIRINGVLTPIIIITGYGDVQVTRQAFKAGAQDLLEKPYTNLELIISVSNYIVSKKTSSRSIENQIDLYIQTHSNDYSFTLTDLCNHFNISARHTIRLLRKSYQATFRQRLTFHRIEKAKILLKTSDLSMKMIAYDCGFKSQRRFSEVFKQKEGIQPLKFRLKNQ